MGIDTDQAVRDRYSAAAQATESALCCPVDYDPRHLEVVPQRVLDRDYGCGDPSSHLRPEETVLNLVRPGEKRTLFEEIHRVVKDGGRAVISDIVSDESVPEHMRNDSDLWSGCISGALREDEFLQSFVDVGFHGVRILERGREPWRTVEGIEFRSLTVEAFKGQEGPCWEGLQAVIYKGPFSFVEDDDGHRIPRGVRYAVCRKTFDLLSHEPYRESFELVEPREVVSGDVPYGRESGRLRHPRETKGADYDVTTGEDGSCCGPECC